MYHPVCGAGYAAFTSGLLILPIITPHSSITMASSRRSDCTINVSSLAYVMLPGTVLLQA